MIPRTVTTAVLSYLLAGCATYTPRPLEVSDETTARALDRLVIEASDLNMPQLAGATVRIAPDGSMNPTGAAALAVVANPDLRAARAKAGVARAQLIAAGILPNPQLTASADVPSFGATNDTVTAYGVGLSWDITSLLAHDASISAARSEVEAVDLQIAWEEWQTAMVAKLDATRVAWIERRLRDAISTEGAARLAASELSRALDAGWVTEVETSAAAAAVERAVAARIALASARDAELLALKRAIGLAPGTPIIVIDDVQPVGAPPTVTVDELDRRRLDLVALRRGYESQEERLRGAVLSQYPKISVGFNAGSDTSDVGTLGLGVSIDVPLFDRGQGRIAAESATREQLHEEFVARCFSARAELAQAEQQLAATLVEARQSAEVVARLERLAASLAAAVSSGQAQILASYEVRQQLAEANQARLALEQSCAEIRVAFETVSGRLIEETR
ncbi:MAG: TolC family protein [Phycisphaerales bacterium]